MIGFVKTNDDGRIESTTTSEDFAINMIPFDFPKGFDFLKQSDYRIVNGEIVYDPILVVEPEPTPVEAAVSYLLKSTPLASAPADDIVAFRTMWPDWQSDTDYKENDSLQYDEKYWRVSQDLTSSKVYPPGSSESLYYEVQLADDGIIIYRTCHGKYDSVRLGEKRHYPDADGPVYESLVDYNEYSPKDYPDNWKLVE